MKSAVLVCQHTPKPHDLPRPAKPGEDFRCEACRFPLRPRASVRRFVFHQAEVPREPPG